MIPLRLTWTLATQMVVSPNPLHLDALIGAAMASEGRLRDAAAWDERAPLDLPLARESRDGLECWKASALIANQPGEQGLRFWTLRNNINDFAKRLEAGQIESGAKFPLKPYAQKFDTVRGGFKQSFKFFPVRDVRQLQAWCVGDIDRLAELLSPEAGHITYLGAKKRMGFGRIVDFQIEPDEQALENWKLRVLPWSEDDCVKVQAATKMPYSDVANQAEAWVNPLLFN